VPADQRLRDPAIRLQQQSTASVYSDGNPQLLANPKPLAEQSIVLSELLGDTRHTGLFQSLQPFFERVKHVGEQWLASALDSAQQR